MSSDRVDRVFLSSRGKIEIPLGREFKYLAEGIKDATDAIRPVGRARPWPDPSRLPSPRTLPEKRAYNAVASRAPRAERQTGGFHKARWPNNGNRSARMASLMTLFRAMTQADILRVALGYDR